MLFQASMWCPKSDFGEADRQAERRPLSPLSRTCSNHPPRARPHGLPRRLRAPGVDDVQTAGALGEGGRRPLFHLAGGLPPDARAARSRQGSQKRTFEPEY